MAPPRKRRRLSQSIQTTREMTLLEPTPTPTPYVSNFDYDPGLYGAQTVPNRIAEVHLHIQQRSVALKAEEDVAAALQRRQTAYEITTVDANGNTVLTTITVGYRAGAASSFIPGRTTQTTPSPTPADSDQRNRPSDERTTASDARNTAASNARVSAAAAPSDNTSSDDDSQPSSEATNASVYEATLSNSNVKTITRSQQPYITTFGDGQTSTICGLNSQCRLAAQATNSAQSSAAAVGAGDSSESNDHKDDGDGSPSLATIAGGVVGALAGIAIILIIILFLLRWYKRRTRQRHHALDRSSSLSPEPEPQYSTGQSGMAERAGLAPLVGTAPAFMAHQNKSLEEGASSERGFSKVSGRKMPSPYRNGVAQQDMYGPPPNMPLTEGEKDFTGGSYYRDSTGFYGGDGSQYEVSESPEPPGSGDQTPASMMLSPGPQRRPTIHEPGPFIVTPSASSPNTPPQHARYPSGPGLSPFVERSATLTRSETPTGARSETPSTIPDNRSSRFTEDF